MILGRLIGFVRGSGRGRIASRSPGSNPALWGPARCCRARRQPLRPGSGSGSPVAVPLPAGEHRTHGHRRPPHLRSAPPGASGPEEGPGPAPRLPLLGAGRASPPLPPVPQKMCRLRAGHRGSRDFVGDFSGAAGKRIRGLLVEGGGRRGAAGRLRVQAARPRAAAAAALFLATPGC